MNKQIRDLTGQKFGKLTVLKYTGKSTKQGHNAIWLCRCECGKILEIRGTNLTTKRRPQISCGCVIPERAKETSTKHGGTKERLYQIWMGMRRRCGDPKIKDYPRYGGRGIQVCDEWQDYSVFRKWAISNGYDQCAEFQKCTLDRIDPNGNYEPDNCRWVDIKTQENNRRNNHLIEYEGKTQNLTTWARELGIDVVLLRDRIRHGWSFERAITTPVQTKRKKISSAKAV